MPRHPRRKDEYTNFLFAPRSLASEPARQVTPSVEGLPTGTGSRATPSCTPRRYPPSVQRLLALGASLTAFNPGNTSTTRTCLTRARWAPRAPAPHVLEFSRERYEGKPAAFVDAFGMRLKHGSLNMHGVLPLAEDIDMAVFFLKETEAVCCAGHSMVQTLPRSKEILNHPISQNALLPNGTLPRLEPPLPKSSTTTSPPPSRNT
ncbi:hypothetical protein C0992_006626 [Termitomyces sp. T32_za158]|nr:hypothetical protein C0992_006626 [Termitomyces sp. T32_za158]